MGPHAVVACFHARVRGDQVEGPEAVGRDVGFDLDVQDVVPLGEVPVLVEVARDGTDLGLVEAVDLEAAVEELEGASGRGCEQRGQGDERQTLEHPSDPHPCPLAPPA
jgi:hypothetical protein